MRLRVLYTLALCSMVTQLLSSCGGSSNLTDSERDDYEGRVLIIQRDLDVVFALTPTSGMSPAIAHIGDTPQEAADRLAENLNLSSAVSSAIEDEANNYPTGDKIVTSSEATIKSFEVIDSSEATRTIRVDLDITRELVDGGPWEEISPFVLEVDRATGEFLSLDIVRP